MPGPLGNVMWSDNFERDPLGYVISGWTLPGSTATSGGSPSPSPSPTPTPAFAIISDGTHVMSVSGSGFPVASAGQSSWSNYQVSADVKTNPSDGHARVIARHQSDTYFYACGLDHAENGEPAKLFLGKLYNGTWYTFATTAYTFSATAWYHIDFAVQGDDLYCQVTDSAGTQHAILHVVESYFPAGNIGATGEHAEFDNFVVKSLP